MDKILCDYRTVMQESLRDYAQRTGGVRVAPSRIVVKKVEKSNPVLKSDFRRTGAPEEGFPSEGEERLAELNIVNPSSARDFKLDNPFNKEKVLEHPLYQKAEVTLEPKQPSWRYQVVDSKIPSGMNKMRREQELINPFTTKSEPQLQSTKQMRPLRSVDKRVEAISPDQPSFNELYKFQPLKSKGVRWNIDADPDDRMYHNQNFQKKSFNELRLQKKKEQQISWKKRQDEQKKKVDDMLRSVVETKVRS